MAADQSHQSTTTSQSSDPEVQLGYRDAQIVPALGELVHEFVDENDHREFYDRLRLFLDRGDFDRSENAKKNFYAQVSTCRACPSLSNPTLPKWNTKDPKVLIVTGGVLHQDNATALLNALKSSTLQVPDVCLTSVVRCEKGKPSFEDASRCSSNYLFYELQLLKPQWIIAAGSLPVAALTGEKRRVSDVVSKNFFLGPWRIRATYDPGYAARSDDRVDVLTSDIAYVARKIQDNE